MVRIFRIISNFCVNVRHPDLVSSWKGILNSVSELLCQFKKHVADSKGVIYHSGLIHYSLDPYLLISHSALYSTLLKLLLQKSPKGKSTGSFSVCFAKWIYCGIWYHWSLLWFLNTLLPGLPQDPFFLINSISLLTSGLFLQMSYRGQISFLFMREALSEFSSPWTNFWNWSYKVIPSISEDVQEHYR